MRLSMRNERGDELFVITPCGSGGKSARQARETALDALADAIDAQHAPGRVMLGEVA